MENKELVYYPVLDLIRPKAQEFGKKIQEDLGHTLKITDNLDEANAILVGGGDGFMLESMKKYYDFSKTPKENKLFFGINCGTLGFLLNDIHELEKIPKTTDEIDVIKGHIMEVEIIRQDTQREIKYAINDVVVGGNVLDYFKFYINGPTIKEQFHGTGVMVSTALGSSAYRLNNGGPLMSSGSNIRGVSGIAALPFRPRGLKPEKINIQIRGRTPAMVGVDGYQGKVDGIKEVTIRPTSHYVSVMFRKDEEFNTKRMMLSQEKVLREDF